MRRLAATAALIALAWGLSSVGYFWTAPALSAQIGYNDAPLFYSAYYALWAAAVFLLFRRDYAAAMQVDAPRQTLGLAALLAVVFTGYAMLVLPRLPAVDWTWPETPVEFFWATSWYFLPKSVEILFQQLLIAALVLALNAMGLRLRAISGLVALMFGGFHLTLAFSYDNPLYVLRYTVAATAFGALVPWLLLRRRHGFLISYAVHWGYYAADAAIIHFVFAAR